MMLNCFNIIVLLNPSFGKSGIAAAADNDDADADVNNDDNNA